MSSLSLLPPSDTVPRDMGPLAWVMQELQQSLDEAVAAVRQFAQEQQVAQATDLADVDSTALRMARQRLHQAVGALEMVDMAAPAQCVRALEAVLARLVQQPTWANAATVDSVAQGARCVSDYLERALCQRALPALALFPTYRAWQQLAGAARAHPADLWQPAQGGGSAPVSAFTPHAVLPEGRSYQAGPAVRAHFDRGVLHIVKQLQPQAALPLAQLAAGLGRGAHSAVAQHFWWVAAAYFEAVSQSLLPDSVHVKRAASSILLQYTQWSLGQEGGMAALAHDLQALLAQAVPAQDAPEATPCLLAVWQQQGWRAADAWNWERHVLGAVDPAQVAQARQAVAAFERWWSLDSVADAAPWPLAALDLARAVASALAPLHPVCQPLAAVWEQLAQPMAEQAHARTLSNAGQLELSLHVLCLGAELDDFDALRPDVAEHLAELAQRLHVHLGPAAPSPGDPAVALPAPDWMVERYRSRSAQHTLHHLAKQLHDDVLAVAAALDAWWRPHRALSASAPPLHGQALLAQLERMHKVVQVLGLEAGAAALAVVQEMLRAGLPQVQPGQPPWEPGGAAPPPSTAQAELVGSNLAALAGLFDMCQRQSELAQRVYIFDPEQRLLRCLDGAQVAPVTAAVPAPVPTPGAAVLAESPEEGSDGDDELLAIFCDEAVDVLDQSRQTLALLMQQPDQRADLTALRRAFHTLKGSARMVQQQALGEAAWAMEQLLNIWLAESRSASPALLDLCVQVVDELEFGVRALAQGAWHPADADDCAQRVRTCADALRLHGTFQALRPLQPSPVAGPAIEPPLLTTVVTAATPPLLQEAIKVIGPLCIDLELYNTFLSEADDWSRRLSQALTPWADAPGQPLDPACSTLAHTLAGAAATVGHHALAQLARALEQAIEHVRSLGPDAGTLAPPMAHTLVQAAEEVGVLLHQFAAGFLKAPQEATLAALAAVLDVRPSPAPASVLADTLDRDLFAVFEDEAAELLPRLGAALRQWATRPDNLGARAEGLRNLHTLKGSARLAGALRLGEQVHALESAMLALPEPLDDAALLRPVLAAFDALLDRFDALRRTYRQAEQMEPTTPMPTWAEGVRLSAPEGEMGASRGALPASQRSEPLSSAPAAMVRVRSDLLDRLMTQAGDVMLSRNRLENDMRALRLSFQDMSANIQRLRQQLRDLEIQTDTQVQSRLAQTREADPRFDPLEFDRYTRVQELTRLLAESVNDVATVQFHLQRSVEAAEGNLAAQARQTRDLQRDLLRSRMVAFDALAERLHRTVRQTADALDKSATLHIEGADIEADRSVLERLAPALEHLLRNAVVHGIEPPAQRLQAGKPASGQLVLMLQQEGNDLALTLSDDGAGLDIPALRERALAVGGLDPDAVFGPEEAARSMFVPGLSTAGAVSELAGRGVGLDAVRSDVLSLGGRIEWFAPPAGGTGFRLLLPLSLAVTQVLLLRVGDFTFGVPTPWVTAVRRSPAAELTAAYLSGQWQGGAQALMPFFWAGALLALSTESTDPLAHQAHNWPVLEFYSAGQQVAWHVDEVLGQQEVVVKPLGAQLAHMPGLVAATVLASGAVALIYNPVALTAWCGETARAWVRTQRTRGIQGVVPRDDASAMAQVEAPLVLVVDDSITVRRVTQRLLQREGYRVALAADGMQALERLRQEQPVVVLCDIEMPRMDGFELLRHLREEPAWADLPVVMITSRLADKHREHARSLGVDHYLGKPYDEEPLLALVAAYARLAPGAPEAPALAHAGSNPALDHGVTL